MTIMVITEAVQAHKSKNEGRCILPLWYTIGNKRKNEKKGITQKNLGVIGTIGESRKKL